MIISKIIHHVFNAEEILTGAIGKFKLKQDGVSIGHGVKLFGIPIISLTRGSIIKLGDFCVLRSRSRNNAIGVNHRIILRTQSAEARLLIGSHVGISGGAICAKKSVTIGDYCLIGSNVVIADNDFHPVRPKNRRYNRNSDDTPAKEIVIGNNVWIGTDTYVLKGVKIGNNSVIGARSVVTKDIPQNCIAAGNPAAILKEIESD